MAMTASTETGGSGFSWKDIFGDVKDLGIEYIKAKNYDVETSQSGGYIPDRADMVAGQDQAAAGDSLGGAFNRTIGGFTVGQWGIGVGVALVSAVVLKKTKVI